jgi:thymidine kinase
MYGTLTVVTGCMFAGKTSHIITATAGRTDAIVFKPMMDIRYAANEVVTHTGNRIAAVPVRLPDDLVQAEGHKLICLDEIQFFAEPYYGGDIIRAVKVLLKAGRDVLVCGLDTDWRGDPFPVTASLAGMADEVIKLKARCSSCGLPASKTHKKTRQGQVVELGNDDIYEARCNSHWTLPN